MVDFAQDSFWMKQALLEGCKGLGQTSPNPPVGAVIIKNGQLIGKGHHQQAGQLHAERQAIANAIERGFSESLSGSTIYVTLEPCSTYGKTPPCTDAIIEHGMKRVVYGVDDPNPENAEKSKHVLKKHGIKVLPGMMENECRELIKGFMTVYTRRRPWVIAKTAMTLDGRITRQSGKGKWLTGSASRKRVHTIRSMSDAILIGGETLRVDNPALTIRETDREGYETGKQPWRIILTRDRNKLPQTCCCLTDKHKDKTLVVEKVDDYQKLVQNLAEEYDIHILMLECGGRLMKNFLENRLVDEWIGFYAPLLTGGPVFGVDGGFLTKEAYLENVTFEQIEKDICIRGRVEYSC